MHTTNKQPNEAFSEENHLVHQGIDTEFTKWDLSAACITLPSKHVEHIVCLNSVHVVVCTRDVFDVLMQTLARTFSYTNDMTQ